ncbi:family 78 glycoside hydrolase catalytic domain [Arthrobacter sp. MAHUQ-56]
MISPDTDFRGAPLLRREFTLEPGHGEVAHAVLRATALGIYEVFLNGAPIDELLGPGWSSYEWRVRYRTHDVTEHLTPVAVLGVAMGNGWYRGRLGWTGRNRLYGEELGFMAQLDITYADGFVQTVATDETWQAGPSATVENDLYDGQTIDARLNNHGWYQPGGDVLGGTGVHILPFNYSRLSEAITPPITRHEVLKPTKIWTSPSGKTLVDFGQNLVGWVRFTVQGKRGEAITIRHAEVLEEGELGVRPLRGAKATDVFVMSGEVDHFEPTKTFHGFRYAEVNGWPGELDEQSLEAVVVHSALERTGTFECSNDMLNQLHHNVVWGLKGNFLSLPTDCPQRSERLGWTGDIAVFAPTAAYLYDVKAFLVDWLQDLAAEQRAADGQVPYVVPDIFKFGHLPPNFPVSDSTAMWADAAVWVPWALWEAYGDKGVLEQQYDSMATHIHRVEGLLSENGLWDVGFQFADWLDPDAPPQKPGDAKADKGVVATSCLYRSATLMTRTAELLGRKNDATYFAALADRVQKAFNLHYVFPDGRIRSDCATVYTLALVFELLPSEQLREAAGNRLAELVRANAYKVSTGFAGTPYITWALSETGHLEDAYGLLLEKDCPSWLYPVTMGATTVWERWDSMLPDGTINPGSMTSFNHYALGSVADWMHQVIGGIRPAAPGYRRVKLAPRPGDGVHWAKTSVQTQHGRIRFEWLIRPGGTIDVSASIPEGVTAELDIPGVHPREIPSGSHSFTVGAGAAMTSR